MDTALKAENDFMLAFMGRFNSTLRWPQMDELWAVLNELIDDGWFIYAIGESPPEQTASPDELQRFLDEMATFLRKEHNEDYCGIVYADDLKQPSFVKIYDPHNLGVSCGFSDNPPLPGWILSRIQPCDLPSTRALPNNRRRWWQKLFG